MEVPNFRMQGLFQGILLFIAHSPEFGFHLNDGHFFAAIKGIMASHEWTIPRMPLLLSEMTVVASAYRRFQQAGPKRAHFKKVGDQKLQALWTNAMGSCTITLDWNRQLTGGMES
jgi:hypothetical protein